jgi:REP element-mobilizing transposase RayT
MHNIRVSERMKRYNVKTENPVNLDENQEIILTKIICNIVREYNYIILAFNICKDHIHFVILCDFEKLPAIINVIKSISSRKFYKKLNLFPKLWAEKFNRKNIDKEKQLTDTINYVNNNRIKHNLNENEELKKVIGGMITPFDEAFI